MNIMAGRGAVVKIPAGAKKIVVHASATIDLDVVSAPFGAYGGASGYFGVRGHLPQGAFATAPNPNGGQFVARSKFKNLIAIHTAIGFPNPVPFGTDSFADTLQDGDDGTVADFELPTDPGAEAEIALYTSGWADADLQGVASVRNDLRPKSMKIAFYN